MPPTVLREDGPFGPGSLQLFVEADYEEHYFTLLDEGGHEDFLLAMCAFDVVANNADRKSGHVLKGTDGRLWGIDHGLCFHRQHKLRTVIWDFAGEAVPAGLLGRPRTAWPATSPTGCRPCSRGPSARRWSNGPGTWGHRGPFPSPRGPAALPVAPGVNPSSTAMQPGPSPPWTIAGAARSA